MRKYRGKSGTVDAAKIRDITPIEKDLLLDDGGRLGYSHEWRRQNNPQAGDWLVVDEGGNARVMSAGEFKNEFEQVPDSTIPVNEGSQERQAARDERAEAAKDRPVPAEQQRVNDQLKRQAEENEGKRPASVADSQAIENANRDLSDAQATIDRSRNRTRDTADTRAPAAGGKTGESLQERQTRENDAHLGDEYVRPGEDMKQTGSHVGARAGPDVTPPDEQAYRREKQRRDAPGS